MSPLTRTAFQDIRSAIGRGALVRMLGWQDVRQRYRRSALGPFWLTISMGVMIGTIGLVFGQIFKTPMHDFLPYLAAGMILWSFISSVVMEGCTGFIAAENIIKQLPIPLFVHILRMIWRNVIILLHNVVILPLVFLAVWRPVGIELLLVIPGFFLVLVNMAWVSLLLGVLCARYRDLPQIVGSALQVVFYLTPIMWMPSHLPQRAGAYLLDLNPVYHLLAVVRSPLLSELPSAIDWWVSIGLAVVGWAVAMLFYGRFKRRIAYWL
jgi:ABC-type polysaccharide/polyol phosphate export permease